MSNYYGNNLEMHSTRIPVQPLPYENRSLAVERELIVNYDDGSMYITADNGKIIDITSKLVELIQNANASNSDITIDGIGTIKLARLLQILWENRMQFSSKDSIATCIPKGSKVDFKSIEIKDNIIQMADYDDAGENTIPVKVNGKIRWRKAASSDSTDLSYVQADDNSIVFKDGTFQLKGFDEAHTNQIPVKVNGELKFMNINDDGTFGMSDEERFQLQENTENIHIINSTIENLNNIINELKSINEDNSYTIQDMRELYSKLNTTVTNIQYDVDKLREELSEIDYDYLLKSIDNINKAINDHEIKITENFNDINSIKNSINIINESINNINEIIRNHINDKNIHNSVHFMDENSYIEIKDRTENHLYINKNSVVTNDLDELYDSHLRSVGTNLGAIVQFRYDENTDFSLNPDLQIQE